MQTEFDGFTDQVLGIINSNGYNTVSFDWVLGQARQADPEVSYGRVLHSIDCLLQENMIRALETDEAESSIFYSGMFKLTPKGHRLHRQGGYTGEIRRKEGIEVEDAKKRKLELQTLKVGKLTNVSTIVIGLLSTIFIIISTWQGCHDITADRLLEINETLKANKTTMDSIQIKFKKHMETEHFGSDTVHYKK